MFVVTIDIWPHGYIAAKYTQTKIAAANLGTGTRERGDYGAWDVSHIANDHDVYDYVTHHDPEAHITNFPRGRDQHHLPALAVALFEALGLGEIAVAPERAAA